MFPELSRANEETGSACLGFFDQIRVLCSNMYGERSILWLLFDIRNEVDESVGQHSDAGKFVPAQY